MGKVKILRWTGTFWFVVAAFIRLLIGERRWNGTRTYHNVRAEKVPGEEKRRPTS